LAARFGLHVGELDENGALVDPALFLSFNSTSWGLAIAGMARASFDTQAARTYGHHLSSNKPWGDTPTDCLSERNVALGTGNRLRGRASILVHFAKA
jgi:hypothetical protein